MVDPKTINHRITKEIKLESHKKESLLYDFIEELLFLLDTEGFLAADAAVTIAGSYTLTARLTGDHYQNYDASGDVKAMTYNDMEICETDGQYRITAVLDI